MHWFTFSIVIACLLISAFFSASETALTGASRASMLRLSKQGNREAGVVSGLFAMRERMIGALLLGTIRSALVILQVNPFWEQAINGALLLLAIGLDAFLAHRLARELRKRARANRV